MNHSPFNSRLKWMKTIHKPPAAKQDQRRMAVLKGAPEIVLKSCTHYYHKGELSQAILVVRPRSSPIFS